MSHHNHLPCTYLVTGCPRCQSLGNVFSTVENQAAYQQVVSEVGVQPVVGKTVALRCMPGLYSILSVDPLRVAAIENPRLEFDVFACELRASPAEQ